MSASEPVDATPETEARRDLGFDRDRVAVPEDFDAPLPDPMLDAFEATDPTA